MVVGPDGALALPWMAEPLARALTSQRGHALLLHAHPGNGALPLALTLAQAWLCEGEKPACGHCGSCRLVQNHLHPDLFVLLPENLRREHGWLLVDDKAENDEAKRKPSRQIRIDEVRALIDWATRTSARGRGKVVVLHPAEALNIQSANALLKTLEEPPPGTRLLLSAADPALLLPTVLSRCQLQRLAEPPMAQAAQWLAEQGRVGADDAQVLLAACSGRPLEALALLQQGVDASAWSALPRAVAAGQAAALAGWPVPRAVDALQKLCHDALARAGGAAPRYFAQGQVPATAAPARLAAWWRELQRVARHEQHPWHEPLLVEALVRAGAQALASEAARPRGAPGARAAGFDTLPP
jgi:DNA polymerase-3 subunit delta'